MYYIFFLNIYIDPKDESIATTANDGMIFEYR